MSYAERKQMSSNRVVAIIVVALIHLVLGYALVTGLAYNVAKKAIEDLKTFDVEDEPPPPPDEPPPPPEKQLETPPPMVAPPPIVRTNTAPPPMIVTPVAPPPQITVAPPRPPAPPPPRRIEPARAKGNLPALFSTDDYPASALRNEEAGTATVRLDIGPDGRVSACTITGSSGSSALDSATCRILRSRARFSPATDSTGAKVSDSMTQRIRWQIPAD